MLAVEFALAFVTVALFGVLWLATRLVASLLRVVEADAAFVRELAERLSHPPEPVEVAESREEVTVDELELARVLYGADPTDALVPDLPAHNGAVMVPPGFGPLDGVTVPEEPPEATLDAPGEDVEWP